MINYQSLEISDWLASNPIFFNEHTGEISKNINDVIDFANIEFHPEGLKHYFDFGYSVFGQTPIKGVKFLGPSSKIIKDKEGKIKIIQEADEIEKWIDFRLTEKEIIELVRSKVHNWENENTGEITIPTSGGFDSRLLNWCISDKSRIQSYTYGISQSQEESFEVVFAKSLSDILKTKCHHIFLGNYHLYFNEWDKLFGSSTHAHGMYQIEFYKKIREINPDPGLLLSGIIGDVWAGSVAVPKITSYKSLHLMGYTHGMVADSSQLKQKFSNLLAEEYFFQNRERLQDPRIRIIEAMRLKLILLCYLFRIPQSLGFRPWSPFLDTDVALSMINLDPDRRANRKWQHDFFNRIGLNFDAMKIKANHENLLNHFALDQIPLQPLNENLLYELINPEYVTWINENIRPRQNFKKVATTYYQKAKTKLQNIRGGKYIDKVFGRSYRSWSSNRLQAYFAYLTIKPIETLLLKRNFFQGKEK